MTVSAQPAAEREKQLIAFSSVLAAVGLATFKLVVGLATNSLGILSEAAHSGLDLIAAAVTFFAVRVSDRPPDREHPYGHGKIENLSALIETLLLLATCAWIVYEAIGRLLEPVHVETSIWSFVVMGASIAIDVTRSRALLKAARKHNSQALEADALHFSTDVWSSSVVIAGLLAVWAGQLLHASSPALSDWLMRADAIAALGVSVIVVYVSVQLGRRTIEVLLDTAPRGVAERIERAVLQVPGVTGVQRLRVRPSGPATFVDISVAVARSASLEEADAIARQVEQAIQGLAAHIDVVVHVAPVVQDQGSLIEQVRSVAGRHGLAVHGIRAYDVHGHLSLSLHVEMPEDLTMRAAHERVGVFEQALRAEVAGLRDVATHIEPVGDDVMLRPAERARSDEVRRAILALPAQFPAIRDPHRILLHRDGNELSVSFHCRVAPDLPVAEAHALTVELESRLRAQMPDLGRVVIDLDLVETPPSA
jgi:cation diffusion facilitator family transporter